MPVMRPIFFADPKDPALRAEEQAFLVGGDVLVIPKWATDAHLPANWVKVQLVDGEDDAPNDKYQPEVRLRPGSIVPMGQIVQNTGEESLAPLTLLFCPDEKGNAEGSLYEDAGDGYGYQHGDYLLTTYRAHREGGEEVITLETTGKRAHPPREVIVRTVTPAGAHETKTTDAGTIRVGS